MATLAQKIQCEKDAREMLRLEGLPDPDRVEYGHTCIRLFWEKSKVVMVVDIDGPPDGMETLGGCPADVHIDDEQTNEDDVDLEDALEELRRLGVDGEEEEAA